MRATNLIALALLSVALLAAGCSSSGRMNEGQKAIESFARLRSDLEKGQVQIDKALAAMDQLATGPDLEKSYKNFGKEVANVEKAGENARNRAQVMRENAEKYIEAWQTEMQQIQDPNIKATLAQRREAVRANFEQVQSAAAAAREAYDPFLADLKQMHTALKIDLSPAAVQGLKAAFDQAHQDGGILKQRITALQGELDKIQAGMGAMPATPATTPPASK